MSTVVDNRVVEMQFDNANFESNVQASMKTIDGLKKSLDFSGVANGLGNINTSASKMDFSAIRNGLNESQNSFSALNVVAATVLSNITNSVMTLGKNLVTQLALQPAIDGFKEYETQINSTQTIMANTGQDVGTVNAALDVLNDYADQTIYNFSEMTRNAGMFTAAGVSLDDTMIALKGVGNWAAFAGANSEQMGRATYQLGQALSAGSIRLQDWISVENAAGMGGEKYKQAFMETARQHGVDVDSIIAKDGSFRESLKQNWLTTDIFIETMQQFADDPSMTDAATKIKTLTQLFGTLSEALGTGWASTWRIIIGDFEEARGLFTDIGNKLLDVINKTADARNSLLQGWKDLGGRDALVDSLNNSFTALFKIASVIKEAFTEIFPPLTAQQLADFSNKIKDLTSKFILTDEQASKLKDVFRGLFSMFEVVRKVAISIIGVFGKLINSLSGVGDVFLTIFSVVGTVLEKIGGYLSGVFDIVNEKLQYFGDNFGTWMNNFCEWVVNMAGIIGSWLGERVTNVIENFTNLKNMFSKKDEGSGGGGGFVSQAGSQLEVLKEKLKEISDYVHQINFAEILEQVKQKLSEVGKFLQEFGGKVKDFLGITDFNSLLDVVKKIVDIIMGLNQAKALNSIAKILKSFSDSGILKSIEKSFSGLGDAFKSVQGVLESYQDKLKPNKLIDIGKALVMLSVSMLILASIDSEKLWPAVGALSVILGEMVGAMALVNQIVKSADKGSKGAEKAGNSTNDILKLMIGMSVGILILASALYKIGQLDFDKMWSAFAVLSALLWELVAVLKSADFASISKETSLAIIAIAAAIFIMALVLKIIASMNGEQFVIAILGLVVIVGVLAALMLALDYVGSLSVKSAASLILVAAAFIIMAIVMKIISSIDPNSFEQILAGLFVIMAVLAALLLIAANVKGNAILASTSMVIIAVAFILMAAAMKIMASIDSEKMNGVISALMLIMIALVVLFSVASTMKGSALMASVSMVIIATAFILMAVALAIIGGIEAEKMNGVISALTMIMLAMVVLFAVAASMQGTALLGSVSMIIIAAAFVLMAIALAIIGSIETEKIDKVLLALLEIFGILLVLMVVGAAIGPYALVGAAALIIIAASILVIAIALKTLAELDMGALNMAVIMLVSTLWSLLKVMTVAGALSVPLILGAAAFIIVAAAIAILGIALVSFSSSVSIFITTLNALAGMGTDGLVMLGVVMGVLIGLGALAVIALVPVVALVAVLLIVSAGITVFSGAIVIFSGAVIIFCSAIITFIETVRLLWQAGAEGIEAVKKLLDDLITGANEWMSLDKWRQIGQDAIQGLINGIKDLAGSAIQSAKNIAKDIWDSITGFNDSHSPSKLYEGEGQNNVNGLIIGALSLKKNVSDAYSDVGKEAVNAMSTAFAGLSSVANSDVQPTIRPVMDLSAVQNGANAVNDLLSTETLSVSEIDATISSNIQSENDSSANRIVSAVDAVNERIGAMEEAITQMKIYTDVQLNGKSLVDETYKGMAAKISREQHSRDVAYGRS